MSICNQVISFPKEMGKRTVVNKKETSVEHCSVEQEYSSDNEITKLQHNCAKNISSMRFLRHRFQIISKENDF